jgi:shikimate dehydrogenase
MSASPSGATRVAGVIGHPVRHSLSPLLHNAAFAALRLDWVYVAFDVADGETAAALTGMRALGIAGLNVTMPHKTAAARLVDDATPAVRMLDAANCVVRTDDGRLVGHNTDGEGFVRSLRDDHGVDPAGARVVVLGAGGAARAVIHALAEAGAVDVAVVNRTPASGAVAARLAGHVGRFGEPDDVRRADIVVNATPVGMGDGRVPLDIELLRPGLVVADLVYRPLETPLLAAARVAGATVVDGLGMLVHQAAVAFTLFTGEPAPVEAMAAAVKAQRG